VISGKGGTGKTSVLAAFAQLASPVVVADCDVDASNLPLIINPENGTSSEPFFGGYFVELDTSLCKGCAICHAACRFNAVDFDPDSDPPRYPGFDFYACEGCGACVDVCPTAAIKLIDRRSGTLFEGTTRFGPIIFGELGIAEGMSGKLVSLVRERAKEVAERNNIDLILIDGSPGIGCPVIASVTGTSAVVIVTEPTVSGLHDLGRVAQLANHFHINAGVIVNKSDLNDDMTRQLENFAMAHGIEVIGRIPFDRKFVDSMVGRKTVIEFDKDTFLPRFSDIWTKVLRLADVK